MLQPEDLARILLLIASLPHRAAVELVTVTPTVQRNWAAEIDQGADPRTPSGGRS
jgi:hypothetical protein